MGLQVFILFERASFDIRYRIALTMSAGSKIWSDTLRKKLFLALTCKSLTVCRTQHLEKTL